MSNGQASKGDVFILVLVLAVMVSGFWMTGKVVGERSDVLQTQIGHVMEAVKGLSVQVAGLNNQMMEAKAAAAHAAAAPAPAPAPAAAKPAK